MDVDSPTSKYRAMAPLSQPSFCVSVSAVSTVVVVAVRASVDVGGVSVDVGGASVDVGGASVDVGGALLVGSDGGMVVSVSSFSETLIRKDLFE